MLLPYHHRSLDVYLVVQHSAHIRTFNILNCVTYVYLYHVNGVPMLFYNMIYTHHSRINISDLLNKFPIICNIRECVEWGRDRESERVSARPLHFHSFVDLFLLDVFCFRIDCILFRKTHSYPEIADDDDGEKEKEVENAIADPWAHTHSTPMEINNRILEDALYIEKCISPIIYCWVCECVALWCTHKSYWAWVCAPVVACLCICVDDGKNVRDHFPIFTIYLFRAFKYVCARARSRVPIIGPW